jgi:hypothetical protein
MDPARLAPIFALPDFGEARFILAMIATMVASVALFTHHLTGGEWVAIEGTILGLYTAHSICDDKIPDRR